MNANVMKTYFFFKNEYDLKGHFYFMEGFVIFSLTDIVILTS